VFTSCGTGLGYKYLVVPFISYAIWPRDTRFKVSSFRPLCWSAWGVGDRFQGQDGSGWFVVMGGHDASGLCASLEIVVSGVVIYWEIYILWVVLR